MDLGSHFRDFCDFGIDFGCDFGDFGDLGLSLVVFLMISVVWRGSWFSFS